LRGEIGFLLEVQLNIYQARGRTMAFRGTPRPRVPLEALFVLKLCAVLVASCGDPQDPSFQTRTLETGTESARLEDTRNSADAVASNPESIDTDILNRRAEELGIERKDELSDLEDLSDDLASSDPSSSTDSSDGTSGSDDSASSGSSPDSGGSSGSDDTADSGDSSGSDDTADSGDSSGSDDTADSGDSSGSDDTADSGDSSGSDDTADSGDSSGSDDTADSGDSSGSDDTADSGDSSGSDDTADSGDSSGSDDTTDSGTEMPSNYVSYNQSAVQPTPRPVDILWVIDSSGSMKEEQNYLANNFEYLVTSLVDGGASFQTAITSTDVCLEDGELSAECPVEYGGSNSTRLRGKFVGDSGSKVIMDSDSDIISKFSEYTKVGIGGSGFEHGLQAAKLAVKKSENGKNEKLVRDNAFLSIIVVSDEEDDGIGLGMYDGYSKTNYVKEGFTDHKFTHEDLISYLKDVKGEGNFAISTVTGTRDDNGELCESAHSSPLEEGTQYIAAAKATGGAIQSICDTDWSNSLGFIGQDIKSQITQISLDKTPYVPTIKVKVNGVESTSWSYIQASNSVKFNANHVPEAGASISIDYYAAP
jgi:hypothetical protein